MKILIFVSFLLAFLSCKCQNTEFPRTKVILVNNSDATIILSIPRIGVRNVELQALGRDTLRQETALLLKTENYCIKYPHSGKVFQCSIRDNANQPYLPVGIYEMRFTFNPKERLWMLETIQQ